MNYFKFYNIPVTFTPDQNLVKKQFYALSKKYHPDFYISESDDKQKEILELSTLNNKAYQTLTNQDLLIPYVLNEKNYLEEGDKYQLSQEFLMEMMEVNEAIMDLATEEDDTAKIQLIQKVNDIEQEINTDLANSLQAYEQLGGQDEDELLKDIKDIWYRKKYLLRIRESIDKFATR